MVANSSAENLGRSDPATARFLVSAPSVEPPKGGGALRGIAEKFTANSADGTASASVPIATSAGRSGFGPQLSLSYNSSAGNGLFGMGWSLNLGEIKRRTSHGLPTYDDGTDVFQLSAVEDLVPLIVGGQRHRDDTSVAGYTVCRYRPRNENAFARIERWTRHADGDTHWRTIGGNNVLSIYGLDAGSRITDPRDARRIFSWLICEQRDDRGNAIVYGYRADDDAGVDTTVAHELTRTHRSVNRYPDRIRYGNRATALDADGTRAAIQSPDWQATADWMFEVVFDYGDYHRDAPTPAAPSGQWPHRHDAFSTRRPGFEVRTTRLCRRVLMFHHFPELGVPAGCLVRSTDLTYQEPDSTAYTFLTSATHTGYRRSGRTYTRSSYPPVEFGYSRPEVGDTIETADTAGTALAGIGGLLGQLVDLDGHGAAGVLFDDDDHWAYSSNVSPGHTSATFSPPKPVATQPNPVVGAASPQLMDLTADSTAHFAVLDGDMPGGYAYEPLTGWAPHRSFQSTLGGLSARADRRLIDLTGDGRADILITEDDLFVWHESLGADGFGAARRVWHDLDEEHCPRLVFSDDTDTVFLADMTGDSLTDLVRIRNDDVCYWPNLGYGRFGSKITLDHTGWISLDTPEHYDPDRVILTDIDGSGTADLIYLHPDGAHLYTNACGDALRSPRRLRATPPSPDSVTVVATDLLGDGTSCLVWVSPLPADREAPLRYIRLMASGKPHLLTTMSNNLGAETEIHYTTSTAQALADELRGQPWRSRVGFPVHVVDTVITRDHLSGNRFTTVYRYRDGHYDRVEREFGGFGRVDTIDTELIPSVSTDADDVEAHTVPPTLTRTWYHTGRSGGAAIADRFRHAAVDGWHSDDTEVPAGLTAAERREAHRALRGATLRTEVYGLDSVGATPDSPGLPYSITDNSYNVVSLQPAAPNEHAAFHVHPRETLHVHLERVPTDPRVTHTATLEVDEFGNILGSVTVAYGRRTPVLEAAMTPSDSAVQQRVHITLTQNTMTNPVNPASTSLDYRTPLSAETRTYELRRPAPESGQTRIAFDDIVARVQVACDGVHDIGFEDVDFTAAVEKAETDPAEGRNWFRRLTDHRRTLYRADDLSTLLPLYQAQAKGISGQAYRLVFTETLLQQVYRRDGIQLITDPTDTLQNRGGYLHDTAMPGLFPDGIHGRWWMPSGRAYLSPADAPELNYAITHFYLPHRFVDPFDQTTTVTYDSSNDHTRNHTLLPVQTVDPLQNVVTAHTRDRAGNTALRVDYRVLQPYWVTDPNGNRTRVAFDNLGWVIATATMGKYQPDEGDDIGDNYETDLTTAQLDAVLASPQTTLPTLLDNATQRYVYDLSAFERSKRANENDPSRWRPVWLASIARDTHHHSATPPQGRRSEIDVAHYDGFGRDIQRKIQAPPASDGQPRWIGSGWTVYDNKGNPVRQYDPFFAPTHEYQRDYDSASGPVAFYDPLSRQVATLHPDQTWQKTRFTPWRRETWDQSDLLMTDPTRDETLAEFTTSHGIPRHAYTPTWYALRTGPEHAAAFAQRYPDIDDRAAERIAADRSAVHANTPTIAHLDGLARDFLTVAHNRYIGTDGETKTELLASRASFDVDDNLRAARDPVSRSQDAGGQPTIDPLGRTVARYDYDLARNRIHTNSMDAGQRWSLYDVAGQPISVWDSRGHTTIADYDALRRPISVRVRGQGQHSDPRTRVAGYVTISTSEYGESAADAAAHNLRGRVVRQRDSAGIVSHVAFDFKGNLLESKRQLVADATVLPDWSARPVLDAEEFTASTRYDARDRPIQIIAPNSTGRGYSIIQRRHNETGQLSHIDVWLHRDTQPTTLIDRTAEPPSAVGITSIAYDARGRRTHVELRNATLTTYTYDPLTRRLSAVRTARPRADFPGDTDAAAGWPGTQVQNLRYAYDPVGNIIRIRDLAQQRAFFDNTFVDPSNDYTYDALYRLLEGTGRERVQTQAAPAPYSSDDAGRVQLQHPGNGSEIRRYRERFTYDEVGNLASMKHHVDSETARTWTRVFSYDHLSVIDASAPVRGYSNRLTSSTVTGTTETYTYDPHGNTTRMPHLGDGRTDPNMHWDFNDRLHRSDHGGGGETHYSYDTAGERIRKTRQKAPGRTEQRIYLGALEIHRRYDANGALSLERETLHISDGQHRFAVVETRTQLVGSDPAPPQLIRYQLGNHLGSAAIELDDRSRVISYEEYSPYGSTTYQALDTKAKNAPKRYRYTGKERDEETGFTYHSARYCVPWLGRWTSCDPAGVVDGPNLYAYVNGNPVLLSDPGGMYGWADFAKDSARVQRGVEIIAAPMLGPIPAIAKSATDRGMQIITGRVVSPGEAPTTLSSAQRKDAAIDLVAPRGAREGIAFARALVDGNAKPVDQVEAGYRAVKAVDPTGILAKADDVVASVERARATAKTGSTGDVVRASTDATLSVLDLAQTTTAAVIGEGAKGEGPSGGGKAQLLKPPKDTGAGKRRLPVVDKHAVTMGKTPQEAIMAATKRVARRLETNPHLIDKYLKPGERRLASLGRWGRRIVFGNAVERALAEGSAPTGLLVHTGDIRPAPRGGPDFLGTPGTPYEGQYVQITSEGGYHTHVEKSPPNTTWGLYPKHDP